MNEYIMYIGIGVYVLSVVIGMYWLTVMVKEHLERNDFTVENLVGSLFLLFLFFIPLINTVIALGITIVDNKDKVLLKKRQQKK